MTPAILKKRGLDVPSSPHVFWEFCLVPLGPAPAIFPCGGKCVGTGVPAAFRRKAPGRAGLAYRTCPSQPPGTIAGGAGASHCRWRPGSKCARERPQHGTLTLAAPRCWRVFSGKGKQ